MPPSSCLKMLCNYHGLSTIGKYKMAQASRVPNCVCRQTELLHQRNRLFSNTTSKYCFQVLFPSITSILVLNQYAQVQAPAGHRNLQERQVSSSQIPGICRPKPYSTSSAECQLEGNTRRNSIRLKDNFRCRRPLRSR